MIICDAANTMGKIFVVRLFDLAGEKEWETSQQRFSRGGIVVPPSLLVDMRSLRDSLPGMKEKYPTLVFE